MKGTLLLAVDHGATGVFNIAETTGAVAAEKARKELGWNAELRVPARLLRDRMQSAPSARTT